MRAVHGLLLIWFSLAAPAFSQDDSATDQDGPVPATETVQPRQEPPRAPGGIFGAFRGAPVRIGNSRWIGGGDIDGLDGLDARLQLKYEDFRFILDAGRPVRISATSLDMDPRIRVLAADSGQVLAEDEDGGRGTNARLTFTPPDAGLYVVRVLGTIRGLNGPFRLSIEPATPLPAPVSAAERSASETTRWTAFNGELSTSDSSIDGLYFDDYRISLEANQELFVRLDSTEFDPLVQVYPAADREGDYLASDDDSGPGRNSLLLFRRREAGDFVIRVTTFSDRVPTGHYMLRLGR